jgi:hypothetical protein
VLQRKRGPRAGPLRALIEGRAYRRLSIADVAKW